MHSLPFLETCNLLKLAITNVVQNACKYSNNGKVTISLRATDKQCILIVEDHGIGIPQKELRYIFRSLLQGIQYILLIKGMV